MFWSRYYRQQSEAKLTATLAGINRERQAIIGEVVRDLKHQLGNYLNIIKHRLAVMRGEMEHLPPEQQKRWGQRLVDSLDNIEYLFNQQGS